MALPQQKFREVVFQLLYSSDFVENEAADVIPFLMHQLKITKKALFLAQERVKLIQAKEKELDALIGATAVSYSFERITRVEKNILRLAIYELEHDSSIPKKVVISEAIRIARKFATPEGSAFVNAILDVIVNGESEVVEEHAAALTV